MRASPESRLSAPVPACEGLGPPNGLNGLSRPEIASHVWGVDGNTWRVSMAAAGPSTGCSTVEISRDLRGAARMHALYEAVVRQAWAFAERFPPLTVVVEELIVFPGRTNPELYMAAGAVSAALCGALKTRYQHPVSVHFLPVSTWKKHSVGYGNAKKPAVLKWAQAHGYPGTIEDEADAWGIAHAGLRLLEQGEQLKIPA